MKLVRCEWAPSLVVEWLCGELEERGIPGPTYAHTLLSLLHHHYCPHPDPATHNGSSFNSSVAAPCQTGTRYRPPLSRRLLDDFDLRNLDLDDLLDNTTHPDADLPDLSAITQQQPGGSRRARKRHKVRQKHRILTSEQLQKVAALQCLMSASDERYDLESLVEELCSRLKTAAKNNHINTDSKVSSCITSKSVVSLNSVSQESSNDTEEYTSSSTPEEQAEKYYAAFPPLTGSSKVDCSHEKAWKSGDAFCSCVWECRRLVSSAMPHSEGISDSSVVKMPRMIRKKHREKCKKEGEMKQELTVNQEEPQRHTVSFMWHLGSKHKDILKECYDTDSASEPERSSERKRKKFVGPLLDEDIGEGYIGDTSSRESSEDRDKGEQDGEKVQEEKLERSNAHNGENRERSSQEEWECMGDLVLESSGQVGEDVLGGRNRLFERGSTSGGTSGSSSDTETQEAKSVKQLEKKISNTVAQVWGQAGELLGHDCGEHVWDPPAHPEPALYTTAWDLSLPKHQDNEGVPESLPQHPLHSLRDYLIQEPQTPTLNDWHQSCSWHPDSCLSEEGTLMGSVSNQSPFSGLMKGLMRDPGTHLGILNNFQKSFWSDCNANDITGSENVLPLCLEQHQENDAEEDADDDKDLTETDDLEKKLLESFMQLSLENLWENSLALEHVFTDISVSNSNLESVSENSKLQGAAPGSHTDSEHEKMMAMVEDVCNSDESQEEETLDSSSKDLPSGPIGPHAVLRHTENSGFSMVVPRGRSAESSPAMDQGQETPLMCDVDGSATVTRPGLLEGMNTLSLVQEEENLLTSPRTHFRPIRQDSIGSITDDHFEDGTMFMVNSERPDLPFQRTSSGALFLESDILEGSPKKYMVYKEPAPKVAQGEEGQSQVTREKLTAIALVPKFKVVNNEKFCQTEEDGLQNVGGKACYKIKIEKTAFSNYNSHCFLRDDEREPDMFEFQQQDFPDNTTLANIWKHSAEDDSTSHLKSIWQVQREDSSGNAWPDMNNRNQMTWPEKEGEGPTECSNESYFEPPHHEKRSTRTKAVVIPTSLASLWHQNSSPESSTVPSMPSVEDFWGKFKTNAIEECELEAAGGQKYIITNPTTHIPEKYSEASASLSSMMECGPWSVRAGEEMSGCGGKGQIWSEKHLSSSQQLHHISDHKRITSLGGTIEVPGVCSELRLEVDQEADELLGAVHAHTSLPHGLVVGLHGGAYSPRPLHERLKKNRKERKDSMEQEDLADLAPDWGLNDGFEWGLQPTTAPEVEDVVADEEQGDGEVLIYEHDGVVYTIPVEYLDDSVYDQIFGESDASTHRLGTSLPDLPSGNPSSIFLSSELEEKWKRSGVPYKVQFPRKSRPGRWLPPSRRPCTFFMEGSCRRSDCKFSHDLASITCRFWEEGSCLKGITCPFLHGYPLRRRRNKSEGAAHSEGERLDHHGSSFEIDSEMDFPTLGSSCDSKASSTDEQGGFILGYQACAAKKKKRKFITITKNVLGELKGSAAGKAFHRIPRRDRRRRHTEVTAHHNTNTTTSTASKPSNTNTTSAKASRDSVKASSTTITTTKPSISSTTAKASTTSTAAVPPDSSLNTELSRSHRSSRKAKRHRAAASGHDDGTVSDY